MEEADWIVDFGPGAGRHGGEIVAAGTPAEVKRSKQSLTGGYLRGELAIEIPARRRAGDGRKLTVVGARENNLKNVEVDVPLGLFVCVTGVSGAGKSTLVNQILYPAVARALHGSDVPVGAHDKVAGLHEIDKVIDIDQSPIGRTPRSNPATYTKLFDLIRDFFALLPEARMHGYTPGRFSFNVKGGRCEACEGDGVKRVEMHFLPDVYVPCEVCRGKRFNEATLQVKYNNLSIADVLDLTVDEALQLFKNHPQVRRALETLVDVGLGYIALGQSSPTLSGGEAQRVKLSRELSKRSTGRTLYVLDEPTTGLHFDDIKKLLHVLDRLVEGGNTVVVIEHNLDVIKTADWIVDIGPTAATAAAPWSRRARPSRWRRPAARTPAASWRRCCRRPERGGAPRAEAAIVTRAVVVFAERRTADLI
jgi:excinuclease ABC subunit A